MIVSLLNTYKKLGTICNNMKCENKQRIARIIRKYISKGVIAKHFIFPLELMPVPCSIAIVSKHQKTRTQCFKKPPRVISKYASYAGAPVEVYYLLEDHEFIENNVDTTTCRLEVCEEIVETIIPREKIDVYEIELTSTNYSSKVNLDSIDINIVSELFRISNPPLERSPNIKIVEILNSALGLKSSKYHYYNHVYKYVLEHYSFKNNAEYLFILVTTPSGKELENLLNAMIKAGLLTGVWQIHCLSKIPITALIHAWGYFERFLDEKYEHSIIKNTSYTIYPVLGVKHGH
jgi:hypothetical protein